VKRKNREMIVKRYKSSWELTPVIVAAHEAEIGRILVLI
jgi:hypothetical protein